MKNVRNWAVQSALKEASEDALDHFLSTGNRNETDIKITHDYQTLSDALHEQVRGLPEIDAVMTPYKEALNLEGDERKFQLKKLLTNVPENSLDFATARMITRELLALQTQDKTTSVSPSQGR